MYIIQGDPKLFDQSGLKCNLLFEYYLPNMGFVEQILGSEETEFKKEAEFSRFL